ncbi:MAG: LysR family transcriptional regulator [Rhodoferax sp.]|uniref:LysR family transcriptional regulator n=1 Tax=Rhodoferax sp. TaxID=50421 RepID=UPI00272645FD|nr:LysR family transcriptional regulator [Rhodoferax sp.]MDO8450316.1 LysR family transcriptional regulator [Rhodoferax sp.]
MNPVAVKLFLEVADAGSLNKVAARRQTAQSHISRQIADFEAQCGGILFRRTGRGVVLTELGLRAATRLRPWLQDTERLTDELRAASGEIAGEVRLGIIPSAAHPLVTRLFAQLIREHPKIRLDVAESQGAELDAMLDSGAVDLAILFRFQKPSGSDETLLSVANTYLVSAPGDALTRVPTLHFACLSGLKLVLPRRPSHWRNALDETARGLGFRLDAVAQADSLTLQKELVAAQPGLYSILGPYSIAAELRAGRLQASRLVRPDLVRHVTLALPRTGKLSPACRVVAASLRSLVESWGHQITEP